MPNDYVVDAHALIWYLEANPRLGPAAKAALDDPTAVLHFPVIALAEACWVVEKKRCSIPDVVGFLHTIENDVRLVTVPLDRRVLDLSLTLTTIPEMHDRLIAATLLLLRGAGIPASLLTRDPDIISSGIGPIIW
jgi:PIN domain nuclease of toxin-antitoxin system